MIVRGSCPHRLKILAREALPERLRADEFDAGKVTPATSVGSLLALLPLTCVEAYDLKGTAVKLVRAKIVPDTDPNADGVWVALPHDLDLGKSWTDHEIAVSPYIPEGQHIVAVDQFYFDSLIKVGNQAGYVP